MRGRGTHVGECVDVRIINDVLGLKRGSQEDSGEQKRAGTGYRVTLSLFVRLGLNVVQGAWRFSVVG